MTSLPGSAQTVPLQPVAIQDPCGAGSPVLALPDGAGVVGGGEVLGPPHATARTVVKSSKLRMLQSTPRPADRLARQHSIQCGHRRVRPRAGRRQPPISPRFLAGYALRLTSAGSSAPATSTIRANRPSSTSSVAARISAADQTRPWRSVIGNVSVASVT